MRFIFIYIYICIMFRHGVIVQAQIRTYSEKIQAVAKTPNFPLTRQAVYQGNWKFTEYSLALNGKMTLIKRHSTTCVHVQQSKWLQIGRHTMCAVISRKWQRDTCRGFSVDTATRKKRNRYSPINYYCQKSRNSNNRWVPDTVFTPKKDFLFCLSGSLLILENFPRMYDLE